MSNEELVIQIQAGINTADNMLTLWEQTKKFITMLARKYESMAELDDLEQEGYLALNTAAEKYDSGKGIPFINYSAYWIKQYMRRYIDNCSGTIRIPVYAREDIAKYRKALAVFRQKYHREPNDHELCYCLNLSIKQLEQLKKDARMARLTSLDETAPGMEDENIMYSDTVASEEDIESDVGQELDRRELCEAVREQIEALEPDQAAVIYSRFFASRTLKETGKRLGKGIEWARQLEAKALRELRKPNRSKKLKPYFDEYMAGHVYHHVGVSSFQRTWMSATELSVWKLIEEEERLIKSI